MIHDTARGYIGRERGDSCFLCRRLFTARMRVRCIWRMGMGCQCLRWDSALDEKDVSQELILMSNLFLLWTIEVLTTRHCFALDNMAEIDPDNTPALKAPHGVTSNLINPPSEGDVTIIVMVVFLVCTTPFVLIRMYTRRFITRRMWWDDCKHHQWKPQRESREDGAC